ncbi:MAG: phosphodiesterase [Desulfovibrionaceae bacterium]|nr:phosphodiesterase [Desulfovibrionaceae bacterium]
MRLLIASDIHGSTESLHILLDKARAMRPDHVVLLGDLLYHGPRNPLPGSYGPKGMPDGFRELMDICPVIAVRGNCDAEVDLFVLPFGGSMNESCWLVDGPREIFVSHGHHIPEQPPMGGFKKGTIFLRGHTHVPRGEEIDGYFFWNPGSMTLPKQGWPRSYAVCEDGRFRVLTLDDQLVLEHAVMAGE